ncbi:ABC transporter [Candidatus Woesearchaeota archaeon CG1_02_57_44]|nr:MAG: ABC transporter [Candidatus Woesearchaeota archaeon CG1_02_57_44]
MSETAEAALEITDLRKTYPGGVVALDGISFSVLKGDFFALLGPNGAGKSTTMGIVSGLVVRGSGLARVFGHDAGSVEAKSCIGLVPQEFNFSIFEKVEDILVQQAGYFGMPRRYALGRSETLLKKLGLWEKRHAQGLKLSGGMKRKLLIARALMHEPRLLVLDEPTAGVDVETRRSMWEFITTLNKAGTTIILSTHYLEEAEQLCKNIAIIDNGTILADTNMRDFLRTVARETYVLDIEQKVTDDASGRPSGAVVVDEHTLEVTVAKGEGLNTIFKSLDKKGLTVLGCRAKQNRLEQLFVGMTGENGKEAKTGSGDKVSA